MTENGIKYDNSYLWEDILSYSWQQEENLALELTIQSRKDTYQINIKGPRSSKKEIQRLLEGK
ncbi:DUF5673 domain-containing protein [Serpentinicella sp. ANB-PHB4]|uniref:DUF5673 domain-containing protein n=1 Tax=Serpentinicella sp. ANB-PHB4 TaxID=3074076 RepID=UPI00285E9202|nr:DUF5673 domain-containing protein [Serpentinicella sp. ANB-PHB4]MDR5658863.1 DUF5673 domain-containing protein [Serpentinicella sp. ANB-PHB4]